MLLASTTSPEPLVHYIFDHPDSSDKWFDAAWEIAVTVIGTVAAGVILWLITRNHRHTNSVVI